MRRLPQAALLPDGKRLHLQDGPIDLVIEASGGEAEVRAAYDAAARRFTGLLDELCGELIELRQPADPVRCTLKGVVARRMHAAVAPFAAKQFITPMAAVAGSVAEEILGAMLMTEHNLWFYQQLMAELRAAIAEQRLASYANGFRSRYQNPGK